VQEDLRSPVPDRYVIALLERYSRILSEHGPASAAAADFFRRYATVPSFADNARQLQSLEAEDWHQVPDDTPSPAADAQEELRDDSQ
jgi:hypothetical protein